MITSTDGEMLSRATTAGAAPMISTDPLSALA